MWVCSCGDRFITALRAHRHVAKFPAWGDTTGQSLRFKARQKRRQHTVRESR